MKWRRPSSFTFGALLMIFGGYTAWLGSAIHIECAWLSWLAPYYAGCANQRELVEYGMLITGLALLVFGLIEFLEDIV